MTGLHQTTTRQSNPFLSDGLKKRKESSREYLSSQYFFSICQIATEDIVMSSSSDKQLPIEGSIKLYGL